MFHWSHALNFIVWVTFNFLSLQRTIWVSPHVRIMQLLVCWWTCHNLSIYAIGLMLFQWLCQNWFCVYFIYFIVDLAVYEVTILWSDFLVGNNLVTLCCKLSSSNARVSYRILMSNISSMMLDKICLRQNRPIYDKRFWVTMDTRFLLWITRILVLFSIWIHDCHSPRLLINKLNIGWMSNLRSIFPFSTCNRKSLFIGWISCLRSKHCYFLHIGKL